MSFPVIGLALAFLAGPTGVDTTWTVRPGERLEIQNLAGEVFVETWDRNEVSVQVSRGDDVRFEVRRMGDTWRMGPRRGWGDDELRYSLVVPRTMPVDVRGNELAVRVSGLHADLVVSTVDGDIELEELVGRIEARSLDGSIRLSDSEGRAELFSLDDDIRVRAFTGSLRAEATDGDLIFRDVDGTDLAGSTVDGDIEFVGPIRSGGRYAFVTHDGDIDFGVVGELDARVRVSVYEGELASDFPIVLSRLESDREMEFTLAEGAAEVRLESFDGTVRLRRVGDPGREP